MEANRQGCEILGLPLGLPKVRRDAPRQKTHLVLSNIFGPPAFPALSAAYSPASERQGLRSKFTIKMRPQIHGSNFPSFYFTLHYNVEVVPAEPYIRSFPRYVKYFPAWGK